MDSATFRIDTVLSDVHLLLPNARHLMTRLNAVSQPVFISKFKILRDVEEKESASVSGCAVPSTPPEGVQEGVDDDDEGDASPPRASHTPPLDEDGDLDVVRRRPMEASPGRERESESRTGRGRGRGREATCPIILIQASGDAEEGCGEEEDEDADEEDVARSDIIRIEHTMATPLEDVGKQIWRGAFLLADFILSRPADFAGATVLELGAGTGITSVVAATQAEMVYCTDVGEDLLNMCQRNITLNQHLTEGKENQVRVRQLDWTASDFCTDPEEPFTWTEEEVAHLHDETSLIIAADVCYDDDLTDALFRTLYRITSSLRKPSRVYLSIEKRLNFTLRHMEVTCEAYDHFRHCLDELSNMEDGRMQYQLERVPSQSIPQFFQYERVQYLELWRVTAIQK